MRVFKSLALKVLGKILDLELKRCYLVMKVLSGELMLLLGLGNLILGRFSLRLEVLCH